MEPGEKNKQKPTQEKEKNKSEDAASDAVGSGVRKSDGDLVDFYEGVALGPPQQRMLCKAVPENVLADYEQMFETIGNVIKEIVDFGKYEVYVMLYPTLAIGYLQMVWSGKYERAISFVGRNEYKLDDSYKRRVENLKRFRTPEDLPERAQELLSCADTVVIFMARSTSNQFKVLQSQFWTKGQLKTFLSHFKIFIYSDEMMPQARIHLDRPLPAPFAWASVAEPMNIDDDVTCATLSEDHCSVAFGTASGMVHIVAVNKDWLHMNMVRREKLFTAHQEPVLACAGDRQLLTSSAPRHAAVVHTHRVLSEGVCAPRGHECGVRPEGLLLCQRLQR
ncbi:uncharacterized protein LOC117189008 [Drosophila miranda]|uniref:uncharacterized protein LOC117189008 n=1 Tax=Drosophila miranda TaxID=7229 RepID=UPI00143FB5CA|nr:uncharacterized protein LOC117189008 [Drosophila miranda]